jgi:hypothetical protein
MLATSAWQEQSSLMLYLVNSMIRSETVSKMVRLLLQLSQTKVVAAAIKRIVLTQRKAVPFRKVHTFGYDDDDSRYDSRQRRMRQLAQECT